MKKIFCVIIIIAFALSAFACVPKTPTAATTEKPADDPTGAVTASAPETEGITANNGTEAAATEPAATEAPSTEPNVTEAPVTEPPVTEAPVTEPATEPVTEELPVVPGDDEHVLRLHSPETYGSDEFEAYIYLYGDGSYVVEARQRYDELGMKYTYYASERGTYEKNGSIVNCTAADGTFRVVFDSDEEKELFFSSMKSAVEGGMLSQEFHDFFEAACSDDGYSVDLNNMPEFFVEEGLAEGLTGTLSTLVIAENEAYEITAGLECAENQYTVPELGFTVEFNENGTCFFRMEYGISADEDMPACNYVSVAAGSYTENDGFTCSLTSSTEYMKFNSEEDKAAYASDIQEQYDAGYMGRLYYEYYMALISEDGYTEQYEEPETYVFKLFGPEPSHVLYVVEMPQIEDFEY